MTKPSRTKGLSSSIHSPLADVVGNERVTLRRREGGHFWTRWANETRCARCYVTISDEQIYDGVGSLQDSLNVMLTAIGPCDQTAAVRGRLVGAWRPTLEQISAAERPVRERLERPVVK